MPNSLKTFTCEHCGVEFSRRAPDGQRFCSIDCSAARRKTAQVIPCLVCGTPFESSVSKSKFCSRKCKGIGSRLPDGICDICGLSFPRRGPTAKRRSCSEECSRKLRNNGVTIDCEECGKSVYKSAALLGHEHHFCGLECANIFQGRNKIERTCKMCGKVFRWSPSRAAQKNAKMTYCSTACKQSDPITKQQLIRMNQMQQEGKRTSIEVIGYALLDSLGVSYLPQHLIGEKFCVDAFVPSAKTVIQFDGDYWHCNPLKFTEPDARQKKRLRLDNSQDKYMIACGYAVVRIWETDMHKNLSEVKARLQQILIPA